MLFVYILLNAFAWFLPHKLDILLISIMLDTKEYISKEHSSPLPAFELLTNGTT